MSKMPRIYLDYCNFLEEQCLITKTRKIYNLALKNLPATQHKKIWKSYLDFAIKTDCEKTIINVYKRYMKINKLNGLTQNNLYNAKKRGAV